MCTHKSIETLGNRDFERLKKFYCDLHVFVTLDFGSRDNKY